MDTSEDARMDDLQRDLQKIMDYADSILTPYKRPNKEDLLTAALKKLTDPKQLPRPHKK